MPLLRAAEPCEPAWLSGGPSGATRARRWARGAAPSAQPVPGGRRGGPGTCVARGIAPCSFRPAGPMGEHRNRGTGGHRHRLCRGPDGPVNLEASRISSAQGSRPGRALAEAQAEGPKGLPGQSQVHPAGPPEGPSASARDVVAWCSRHRAGNRLAVRSIPTSRLKALPHRQGRRPHHKCGSPRIPSSASSLRPWQGCGGSSPCASRCAIPYRGRKMRRSCDAAVTGHACQRVVPHRLRRAAPSCAHGSRRLDAPHHRRSDAATLLVWV
jgi:hypothetical protein